MESENEISKAEEILCKIAWRTAASGITRLDQMISWGLGGVGAMLTLLVANLDSIAKFVSIGSLKWTITFLVCSLFCGAVAKILAVALTVHLEVTLKVESILQDPNLKELLAIEPIKPEKLLCKIAEPYWWPFSDIILTSAKRIAQDSLFGEKLRTNIYCLVSYSTWAQFASAIFGLSVVAVAL